MTPSHLVPSIPATRVTRRTATFPFVALPTRPDCVPVEVSLVARLGHGSGTQLFHEAIARQRAHSRFVDELDEPSAKLGGSDFSKGDATALYSFGVGRGGHPFHRHAGHRVFTAISGSGGSQLRFSSATPKEIEADPASFVRALHHVDVPPDCIFTVRFSGKTWHQFVPLEPGSSHPAFFALSTHTNELGGQLSDELRLQVLHDKGNIPSLTQLLPQVVVDLLKASPVQRGQVPTTRLSLGDQPGGLMEVACKHYRSAAGRLRGMMARVRVHPGFISEPSPTSVQEQSELPVHSLLRAELNDRTIHHQDRFSIIVPAAALGVPTEADAAKLLSSLLGSFLEHRHHGVSLLMGFWNLVVRPFKLRTSPLACPVSSLLSESSGSVFAGRYPVHSYRVSEDGRTAQVILGADDKHLVFRSSVEAACLPGGCVEFSLSTRVACRNLFGRVYMALISAAHRKYIAPRLLKVAVESMLRH
jgi:hypothetical protein